MKVAGTGHRPNKLQLHTDQDLAVLSTFAFNWLEELAERYEPIDEVISGMAEGWDTALAIAALELDLPLVCAIPCEDQEKLWSEDAQAIYRGILSDATRVVLVSSGPYADWKMRARNGWMVDQLKGPHDRLMTLWDGSLGGTANCVSYAMGKNRPGLVDRRWRQWLRYREEHTPLVGS